MLLLKWKLDGKETHFSYEICLLEHTQIYLIHIYFMLFVMIPLCHGQMFITSANGECYFSSALACLLVCLCLSVCLLDTLLEKEVAVNFAE